MMITFDPIQFKLDYPLFANISNNKLTNDFNFCATILGQVVSSLFQEDDVKYYWLCKMLAHIEYCEQSNLPGRPSQAAEGSDSVGFEFNAPEWASYLANSTYGQEIYQCMLTYLAGAHYVASGQPPYNSNSMNGAWGYAGVGYGY